VIRSDGKIDGYAYGTERKRQLLDIEQTTPDHT
jgi:O6-methylguanine-DNA--protein-cysteine methyltransferase